MAVHEGGCLCEAVRYTIKNDPVRVTICHCKFCQRATGAAYMVEPIFHEADLQVTKGSPAVYEHCSGGSGKLVHIHFCAACGTKLYLTFERFAEVCGVYAGTFDDPNWFDIKPESSKHIFINVARPETILPPGFSCFAEHAMRNDGTPHEAVVFDQPQVVGNLSGQSGG
jgi:hypothetical protein